VNIIWQSTINCQGGTIGIFTLMIPEIANQMVKISSTLKTCDMSDIGAFLINTPRKAITAKLISYR
jgi:hypothetical protein